MICTCLQIPKNADRDTTPFTANHKPTCVMYQYASKLERYFVFSEVMTKQIVEAEYLFKIRKYTKPIRNPQSQP